MNRFLSPWIGIFLILFRAPLALFKKKMPWVGYHVIFKAEMPFLKELTMVLVRCSYLQMTPQTVYHASVSKTLKLSQII